MNFDEYYDPFCNPRHKKMSFTKFSEELLDEYLEKGWTSFSYYDFVPECCPSPKHEEMFEKWITEQMKKRSFIREGVKVECTYNYRFKRE